jgi:hypothetical protein
MQRHHALVVIRLKAVSTIAPWLTSEVPKERTLTAPPVDGNLPPPARMIVPLKSNGRRDFYVARGKRKSPFFRELPTSP